MKGQKGREKRSSPRRAASSRSEPAKTRSRRPVFKAAILVLAVTLLIFFSAGIYYYGKFNRLIDAFLSDRIPATTAIYTRPFHLFPGQRISPAGLSAKLRRIGYPDRAQEPDGDWYETSGSRIRIGHRTSRGTTDVIEVGFNRDRIQSLGTKSGALQQAVLRPEFLSSAFGTAREKKRVVRLAEIPDNLVKALLAAEDERFFRHSGIDFFGLTRAAFINLINWDARQGGSTLTQQFVKNYFLTQDKFLRRKLEEMVLAVLIERRLSKNRILELYCNNVYLGQLGSFAIVGFGQAASTYFGKNVKDLSLAECAVLAGIIQAPNRYSPYRSPEAVLKRRNYVLDLMQAKNLITAEENQRNAQEPLKVLPVSHQDYADAPYFVDYLAEVLQKDYALDPNARIDLVVGSTLDYDLQKAAFESVRDGLADVDKWVEHRKRTPRPQAALIAVDPATGEILALIGGRDYAAGQYNRATRALRQPGSTFKPFVYAPALQRSLERPDSFQYTLSTRFLDEPYTLYYGNKRYTPHNHRDHYYGPVTMRDALALSLNIPAVKLAEEIGFETVAVASERAGLGRAQPFPSIALGSFEVSLLELTQGYQLLANGGTLEPLRAVRKVLLGRKTIEGPSLTSRQIFRPEVAFLVTSALESVLEEGTGQAVRLGGFSLPAAGKTGSTDDAWFVGYTPDLLCAVWVGTDSAPALNLTGTRAALPIWLRFMRKAEKLGYLSGRDFAVPPGVIRLEVDTRTGLRSSPECGESRVEYFIEGTEPQIYCTGEAADEWAERQQEKNRSFWGWVGKIFKPQED